MTPAAAFQKLMEAASGLDRIDPSTGLMPADAWPRYMAAYREWLEALDSEAAA